MLSSKRIRITVTAIIITLALIGVFKKALDNTDRIDLWSQTDSTHVFAYTDFGDMTVLPIKMVTLPLVELPNGKKNYPGNPDGKEWQKWLDKSAIDTSYFTAESYNRRFVADFWSDTVKYRAN